MPRMYTPRMYSRRTKMLTRTLVRVSDKSVLIYVVIYGVIYVVIYVVIYGGCSGCLECTCTKVPTHMCG